MKKKKITIGIIIYLLSSLISYTVFAKIDGSGRSIPGVIVDDGGDEVTDGSGEVMLLEIDPAAPKDQECPLNGQYYTQVEREAWEKRRPLYVMIENAPDARPQSGLSRADVVYEAIAEGGVTRYGALYYCDAQKQDVILAPVRSARTYFVDWASGYNKPLYVHVGGANIPGRADALGQITKYGWNQNNDVNQFSVGYPTFRRNYDRLNGQEIATEHTMESFTEALWKVGEDRGWTNTSPDRKFGTKIVKGTEWSDGFTPWTFEEEVAEKGEVLKASYDFWSGYGQYDVIWDYSVEQDAYLRTLGGKEDVDLNNNQRISAANVVVMFTLETGPIDELKHMLYKTVGRGKVIVFNHGNVTEGFWSKAQRVSEIRFTNKFGKEIPLARGKTWISVVSNTNKVTY